MRGLAFSGPGRSQALSPGAEKMALAPVSQIGLLARCREILSTLLVKPAPLNWEPVPEQPDVEWQKHWGEAYGLKLKAWLLEPLFERLEAEGRIGNVIVDVGSGAQPVTRFLPPKDGRKRVCVDIAAEPGGAEDEMRVKMDVEKVGGRDALSFRKALVRACRFFELNPRERMGAADLMVFSDVLNYVDFREVLGGFGQFLKLGGRMIVVNLPIRGNVALFSEKGLKDNRELYAFLAEEGFEIESKDFPCRRKGETEEAEEYIVLVARKCGHAA